MTTSEPHYLLTQLTSCFIKRVIFVCWGMEYLSAREGIFVVWKDEGQLQPFHSQRWRLNQVRDVIRKSKTIIAISKSLYSPKMFKWFRVLKRLHGHVWRGKKKVWTHLAKKSNCFNKIFKFPPYYFPVKLKDIFCTKVQRDMVRGGRGAWVRLPLPHKNLPSGRLYKNSDCGFHI